MKLGCGARETCCMLISNSLQKLKPFSSSSSSSSSSRSFSRVSALSTCISLRPGNTNHTTANTSTSQSNPRCQLRSPDLVDLEYAQLNLKHKVDHSVGHVRIRQHVNPLSSSLVTPVEVPDWRQVFANSDLPLMVDIGSGSGRFLIWLAKQFPESKNYLGLEIRRKLVDRAGFWVKELSLNNVHFMFANASVSFEQLVSAYPGPLMLVCILVFVQSDVYEVALDMRNHFDSQIDALQHIDCLDPKILCDSEGWLLSNPMGIRTEREIHAEWEGAKIYRRLYQKRTEREAVCKEYSSGESHNH